MKRRNKKLAISLGVGLALTLGTLGVAGLQTPVKTANASAQTANVDVLGNFTWDEVAGATGYTVSYTIGAQAPVSFVAESNQANVGVALTKAIQAGETAITFEVTPTGVDGASAIQYAHTVERYVDYGYASHDFASVKAQASTPTKISELSLDGSYEGWISSAMFKNDVLTIGMRADEDLASAMNFYLFGSYTTTVSSYNYGISQKMDGSVVLSVRTGTTSGETTTYSLTENEVVSAGTDYNTALQAGENYYLQMAVFDTYNLAGEVVGETVYYTRSVYDAQTDELKQVGGFTKFNATADLSGLGSYRYTPSNSVGSHSPLLMEVERSGLYLSAGENNATTRVFSGVPQYEIDAPTGVYYDNFDGTFNWNKVENATAYEYKIGEGEWTEIDVRKVSVENELTEYKTLGYLPFSVRAKGGKVATYNLDLTRFYNKRSLVNDYNDVGSSGDNTNSNKFKKVTTLSGTYGPSSYTQLNTEIVDYTTGTQTAFSYGSHVTLRLNVLAEKTYADNYICKIGLLGEANHTSVLKSYNRYFMTVYGDGTVQLGMSSIQPTSTSGRADRAKFWRVQNVADSFRKGYSYYLTFGVDEVYENDQVVAYRVSARIEERTEMGLDRKLLGIVSYDNERLTDETNGDTITKKYTVVNTPSVYGDTKGTAVNTYKAMHDSNHALSFKVNEQTIANKQVDFGTYYDYSGVAELQNITAPTGYTHDGSWYYANSSGVKRPFPLTGYYGITTSSLLTGGALDVCAKLTPIEYDVVFDKASENASKYTIESTEELKAPTTIPVGQVFDGWYETSDTSYQTKITSLQGKTGNLSLKARFVDGYTITVNGEATGVASGATFTFPTAPSVENKTFAGWEVFNGTEWEEYAGENAFEPTADMQFRAVYDWTEYTLTYVAQGATHTSAGVYTKGETTTLLNATKAGYFFAGWYLDEELTTLVNDTADLVGNQTLYAKFVQNTLKDSVKITRKSVAQELPVPTLPADASYTVKVENGTQNVAVAQNKCVFDKVGAYTATYTITLGTGKSYTHVTTLDVKGGYIVYLHYGKGETIGVNKDAGKTLIESEIPELVEGYIFGGLYADSEYTTAFAMDTAITGDTHVYVKWIPIAESESEDGATTDEKPTTAPETEEKDNTVLFAVIGAIIGLVVGGGACVAIAVMKKKKENEKGE